jgi:hypothetical protein
MSRAKSPEKEPDQNILEHERLNKTEIEKIRKKKKETKLG